MFTRFLSDSAKLTRLSLMTAGALVVAAFTWALWRRLSPWQFFSSQAAKQPSGPLTLNEKIALFPNELTATFGGPNAFAQMPVLDIGDNCGRTGYIDFIKPDSMSHSVMWGADCVNRPFVSFKLTVTINADSADQKENTYVETLFQRYSNDKKNWTTGGQIYLSSCGRSLLQDSSEAQYERLTLTPGFLDYIKRLNAKETLPATVHSVGEEKTYRVRLAD